jgi:two-component system, cell cycle sensor histidine kinase and response regulator CckA
VAPRSDKVEPLEAGRPESSDITAREATRAAQRIASQLHQLIAASLTVTGLRDEREIVESLAGSARRVFDADLAVLSLESGSVPALRGVAERSRLVASFDGGDEPEFDIPTLRAGTSATWVDGEWLVAPIVEGRSQARGVLAVRRSGSQFQGEDREVLTLLAQMAASALGATELTREIESSETRLRTLVDTAPAGIVEVTLEGEVQWWNRAAHQIFAWPPYDAALEGSPTFPDSALTELNALWSEVRTQSTPANRDLVGVNIRGRRRDLTASAVLLPSQDDAPGIMMLVDDVTDHRQLQAEVGHAQQMEIRGRVASSVAHDFNNLLTLISGYAEIIISELDENDTSLEMVKGIQATASRASALTAQLQTIGRTPSLEPVIIDPVATLEDTATIIDRVVGDAITTDWSLDPTAGTIHVDPGQFEQMILNLAMNARDAMPEGGQLRITVGSTVIETERAATLNIEPGLFVEIHVADSGMGMDEVTLAKCFDTFFTTKGPFKGTGMGLAAARRLVEGSRGSISVRSDVGVGTDFEILLPSLGDAVLAPEPRGGVVQQIGTATVLIAEDDDDLRRLMAQVLRRNGYNILITSSGEAALEESRSFDNAIELLVSDVVMGKLSGPKLAGTLQKERPDLRVLLTSGTADVSVTDHLKKGTSAFLAKPFRPSEFIDLVHELLSRET